MRAQPNLAVVGAFVVGLGAAAIVVGLWLAAGGFHLKRQERYIARFEESVSGLGRGAPVSFRGVPVGSVRDLSLEPGDPARVRLVLEVAPGTPVTRDTVAVLAFQGLTGIASVELSGGGRGAPPLARAAGDPYPEIRTEPSMKSRLEAVVTALLGDLRQTTADVRRVVASLAGRSEDIDTAIADAARSLHHVAEASARLSGVAARAGRGAHAVERAADEVKAVGAAARAALADAGRAAQDASRTVRQLDGRSLAEIDRLVAELTEAAAALARVSRELERNRGALLGGQTPPPGPGE
ncbi:Mammalian cell entry related domain protein [Anaeromyxobacter sp. K]|uniref:MlaD family protein n=1 Tax=Anaeromyxobacter sp. (strain K) TaxID=447217 RepID=UPI00017BE336|nr:MlaD family protein [Anaeromyxobacter sp. K]ACG71618.1 Mammalian cell entry related domain protein [Anaeromyxobacter sp. K]